MKRPCNCNNGYIWSPDDPYAKGKSAGEKQICPNCEGKGFITVEPLQPTEKQDGPS